MSKVFVPPGWRPRSHLDDDITVELYDIVTLVMNEQRLPSRDPYLIDVCLAAIKEIQRLRRSAQTSRAIPGRTNVMTYDELTKFTDRIDDLANDREGERFAKR